MNHIFLARALTKTAVIVTFWIVFAISLYLRAELSVLHILFDLVKSLVVAGLSWIFLSVLADTLVKSMVDSAKEAKADRFLGGLSYHVTPVGPEEKEWQRRYLLEKEQA